MFLCGVYVPSGDREITERTFSFKIAGSAAQDAQFDLFILLDKIGRHRNETNNIPNKGNFGMDKKAVLKIISEFRSLLETKGIKSQ